MKKGDFVEVDYTGKLADTGEVFDTTNAEAAKKAGMDKGNFKPIIIELGKNWLLPGIEKQLDGKELGSYNFKVKPEEGFGKKNPKLMQLVATSKFRQQNINPMPGMQLNIDGVVGTIKAVSGGRVIVDFNHPLAGRNLDYDITVKRIVTDPKEKINAMLSILGIKADLKIEVEKAVLTPEKELPESIRQKFSEEIKKSVPEIKSVEFGKKEVSQKKTPAK
ncbi:peptidylprolyl isomerase [Candidatus Woesearchaeota archaeon]|nr:peptidylprolyl isomerase [Candidatus Woesearchaeota archaeon]